MKAVHPSRKANSPPSTSDVVKEDMDKWQSPREQNEGSWTREFLQDSRIGTNQETSPTFKIRAIFHDVYPINFSSNWLLLTLPSSKWKCLFVLIWSLLHHCIVFPGGSVGKESSCNAGDTGDVGSNPGLGRSSGGGNGNPVQYSFLGNPMDRGGWQATVHWVTKSLTWLKHWELTHHCIWVESR